MLLEFLGARYPAIQAAVATADWVRVWSLMVGSAAIPDGRALMVGDAGRQFRHRVVQLVAALWALRCTRLRVIAAAPSG